MINFIPRHTVYRFPPGFGQQAESTYRWLLYERFTPAWGHETAADGGRVSTITLPAREVPCLLLMQRANPARWGNPCMGLFMKQYACWQCGRLYDRVVRVLTPRGEQSVCRQCKTTYFPDRPVLARFGGWRPRK